jgi:hypothetical protein
LVFLCSQELYRYRQNKCTQDITDTLYNQGEILPYSIYALTLIEESAAHRQIVIRHSSFPPSKLSSILLPASCLLEAGSADYSCSSAVACLLSNWVFSLLSSVPYLYLINRYLLCKIHCLRSRKESPLWWHYTSSPFISSPVISSRSFRPLIHFVPGHFVPGHFVPWSFCPLVISSPIAEPTEVHA